MNIKLSGFSDEISSDVKVQFEVLNKLGIGYFEPRGVDGKNISTLTDSEVDALKEKMQSYGIKVSSIGSPIGKIKISDDFSPHFEVFKRVVDIAKKLDTKFIRIFSFYHDGGEWTDAERTEVFARLEAMLDYAKKQDIVLLHENEKDIFGDTAQRCRELLDRFACENFAAVFDPANFVQCGENVEAAFELLKDFVKYMHIKDAKFSDGSVVPAGMGDGCVKYVLSELSKRDYNGFLSLEPHLGSFDGLADLELDEEMLSLPQGGELTFTVARNALDKLLKEIL